MATMAQPASDVLLRALFSVPDLEALLSQSGVQYRELSASPRPSV